MFQLLISLLIASLYIAANDFSELISNDTDYEIEVEKVAFAAFPLEPFHINQNKRYSLGSYVKVNWYRAQILCAAQGQTLATINTVTEHNQLHSFLFENDLQDEDFWLSGTNLAGLDRWFWISNGRALNFVNWARYEPDNNCHCMIRRPNGQWAGANCQSEYFFVCENRCPLDSYNVPQYSN